MDNGGSGFIIFSLGNPHSSECGQRCQDGATDPYRVFPLWWSNDLDLDGGWSQGSDLLLHTVSNTWEHGGATRQDSVGKEILTDINVTLHDAVVVKLVDTCCFHTNEAWLEHGLGGTESLITNGDDLTIRKLVALLQGRRGSGGLHLLVEVQGNVAELLLDVTDNLPLSCGDEAVASLCEDLDQVVGEIAASEVKTANGVWESITLIDWHGMGHAIT